MTNTRTTHRNLTTDQLIEELATRRFQLRGSRSMMGSAYNKIAADARTITGILAERGLSLEAIAAIR